MFRNGEVSLSGLYASCNNKMEFQKQNVNTNKLSLDKTFISHEIKIKIEMFLLYKFHFSEFPNMPILNYTKNH